MCVTVAAHEEAGPDETGALLLLLPFPVHLSVQNAILYRMS
jgi:hypothetical protein